MAEKIRVAPLSGRYTFDEALTALLRDTGLSGGRVRDGIVRISLVEANRGEETVSPKAKATLLSSASAFLLGAFSAPSYAQDADQPSARDIVVVTAQRREQDLQDVPLSVSTFSGEQLEDIGAADITEVGKFSPNVTLEVSRGTNSTLSAFIRGVGQQDPVGGFEAGVGIYLDDVYLNRPQGGVLDVFDVERIEVLRGPQGTLYGRNTIGGAVKVCHQGAVELAASEAHRQRRQLFQARRHPLRLDPDRRQLPHRRRHREADARRLWRQSVPAWRRELQQGRLGRPPAS